MINPSELPPVDKIIVPVRPVVSQAEIDRINEVLVSIRVKTRQILKDAIEVGEWFTKVRTHFNRSGEWGQWLRENFPKISFSMIWRYQRIAANREFLSTFLKDRNFSVNELISMISRQGKQLKPRVRAVVVKEDSAPEILLEAKLKNYVINLWMLRYLQVEIEGMFEVMQLKPEQILKVLKYVCRDHHEVEEEVLRTFGPKPKIVRVK